MTDVCAAAGTCPLALLPVRLEADETTPGEGELLPEPVVEIPSAVERFWLISMSCSRLFTETSWLMYSLGSVFAVGSWFCISVTSSVRKSLAEMPAEELLELSVLPLSVAVLAMGLLPAPVKACPAVYG